MNTILVATTIVSVIFVHTNQLDAAKDLKDKKSICKGTGCKSDNKSAEWDSLQAQWTLSGVLAEGGGGMLKKLPVFGKKIEAASNKTGGFFNLPRTPQELAADGKWKKLDEHLPCQQDGKFYLGWRHARPMNWKTSDPHKRNEKHVGDDTADYDRSIMILTDQHGYIVGVQSSTPKDNGKGKKFNPEFGRQSKFYANDSAYWTQTVYFVDPRHVCEGRNKDEFNVEGTGTGLWIQDNINPTAPLMTIPLKQALTSWTRGTCTPYTGGIHYWFDLKADMNCEDFVPYCLLYKEKRLNGFCFASRAEPSDPTYYDYPAPAPTEMNVFMKVVPDCVKRQSLQQLSLLSVFFKKNAATTSSCFVDWITGG